MTAYRTLVLLQALCGAFLLVTAHDTVSAIVGAAIFVSASINSLGPRP